MTNSKGDDYIRVSVKGNRVTCSYCFHGTIRDFLFDGEISCSLYSLVKRGIEWMDDDKVVLMGKEFEDLNDSVSLRGILGNDCWVI